MNRCLEFLNSEEIEEVLCFQYQCMMRYGGTWHLEKRMALPGYVFVSGTDVPGKRKKQGSLKKRDRVSLSPCDVPYLKELCDNGSLIGISRGVIRKGTVVVTSGPLKGRECLIRKIDRHKRTAKIEIPLAGGGKQITVGLEIYEKKL